MAKVLYIEDIKDNITLVQKIITSRGREFVSTESAENIHKDDPHLSSFHRLGPFENFSRIEMFHAL